MTALELIASRRSVRAFTGQPVDREVLTRLLAAAMAAPSAVNVQPWAFVAVTDPGILGRLSAELPYAKMLAQAGAGIIVCGLPDKDPVYAGTYWIQDCSAATENLLLAAHGLGLGAVWTAVYPDEERVAAVRRICGLPGTVIPLNVVPVGWPAAPGGVPQDKFRAENIHWDRW